MEYPNFKNLSDLLKWVDIFCKLAEVHGVIPSISNCEYFLIDGLPNINVKVICYKRPEEYKEGFYKLYVCETPLLIIKPEMSLPQNMPKNGKCFEDTWIEWLSDMYDSVEFLMNKGRFS